MKTTHFFAAVMFILMSFTAYSQTLTEGRKLTAEDIQGIMQNSQNSMKAKDATMKAGNRLPEFAFSDINGNEVYLSDFKGKYIFIDVWATWCGPCKEEIPHLAALEKRMHGKNIVFLSISIDKNRGDWEKMVKETKMEGKQLYIGDDKQFKETIFDQLVGVPRFILLDKSGRIVNPDIRSPRPSNATEIDKLLLDLEGI